MEALEGFTVNNTEDITKLESQKVEKSEFLKSLTKLNDELFGQSCQIQDVKLENKESRETFAKQLEAFKNFCQVAATNNQKRIEEISTGKSTDERMLSRLKRAISSKADIKELKALESKFIDGIVTDGDDCVIRCLSCHREVREKDPEQAESQTEKRSANGKVGPEPKRKPKVYSSMVPLRAAPMISQKHQDSSLHTVNEKPNDSGRVEVTSSFSIVNTSEHDLQVTPLPTSTENDAINSLTLTPNVKGKKKLKSPEVQFY